MDETLARNWWAVMIRGLVAIAFAVVAIARPNLTLQLLVILFGVYALDDGIFAIVGAVRAARKQDRWWPMALEGVLGIVIGVLAFVLPGVTAAGILLAIVIWAFTTGVLELVEAFQLHDHVGGEWMLVVGGALRIAFGFLLLLRPHIGIAALLALMVVYAFSHGIVLLGLSLRLKNYSATHRPISGMPLEPV
jgi:uncharacterized membrane protein HdeD (DUF308 family)